MKTTLMILAGAVAVMVAQERFDLAVRQDFFQGFAGNKEALERGMKKAEAALAVNPQHAEAMVWHGSGLFFESGQAFRNQDFAKGGDLYKRGLDQMAAAVALEPENVAVIIPRGATLLGSTQQMPAGMAKPLIETGLADYEKTFQLQTSYFDTLSGHARGELLFGLAEGYLRLGDAAKAKEWFSRLAAVDDSENGHLRQARAFMETGKLSGPRTCIGCHTSK